VLAVAAIFGIVNAVLRPIIKTIGCGLYVLTLGLISLVVNGLLFLLARLDRGQVRPAVPRRQFLAQPVLGALLVGVGQLGAQHAGPRRRRRLIPPAAGKPMQVRYMGQPRPIGLVSYDIAQGPWRRSGPYGGGMGEERRGYLYGPHGVRVVGIFPIYFKLLAPATPLEILAHRVIWSVLFISLGAARAAQLGASRADPA
jgi:hypothetical protein